MKTSEEDKEMLGGCCVCSDENGWPDNPLVYCDGEDCNVAVHQACYGIVSVPTGQWFCCRCEAKESPLRARCELCPSKDGALKRTDSGGWAHVVCALYIPEVRFGNVTTMEPIVLQLIPQDRFNKLCYICEEAGRTTRAGVGACMQCNKGGCKHYFHVTCAQERGYLCEEAGNYLDNVKYCGYCGYHFEKLKEDGKKGTNVKTIPPYRPPQHPNNKPHPDGDRIAAPGHGNAALAMSHVAHGNARTSSSSSSGSSSSNRSRMRNEASGSSSSSKSSSSGGSSNNSSSNRRRSVPRPLLHASTRVTVTTASSLTSSSSPSIASTAAISTSSSASISTASSSVLDKMRQPSVVISSRVPLTAGSTAISSSAAVTSTPSTHSSSGSFSSSKSSHIPVLASKDASPTASTAGHVHASSVQPSQTGSKSSSTPATVAATISSALPALSVSSVSTSSTSATVTTSSGSVPSKADPASSKASGHSFVLKRSNFPSTTTMSSTTPATPSVTPAVASTITSTLTMTSVSSAATSSASSTKEAPLAVSTAPSEPQTAAVTGASATTAISAAASALQKAPQNSAPATTEDEPASTAVSTSTTTVSTCSNSGTLTTTTTSLSSGGSSKIGPSSLRRTAGGRSSSSSDDAASSSSSDNLVLNICQEKNLSAVADPSAADVKPSGTTKLKLQAVKESLEGSAAGSSMPAKKEEKMEVDDDSQEFKLKVSYTANMSSVPAPKSDPFTPTPADFAVVTAHVDLMPVTNKRGRSSSSDRGSRRAKRGSRDGSGGSKRGRWSGGARAPHAGDMDQSPPSSPDSDHLITPKRGRKRAAAVAAALELKESANAYSWSPPSTPTLPTPPSGGLGVLTTNGPAAVTSQGPAVSANTLLLGNQINPASAVAQKMTDTLHAELQAHSIYKQEEEERVTTPLVGPALPGKKQSASIGVSNSTLNCSSNGNNSSGGSSSNGATQPPPFPQSLEQLLERQWEQGSQFLMEQAQHFDIASLLSCLHQLRQENTRLEESVTALSARRDHLLAVNARLSVPLGPPSSHVSSASPPAGDVGPGGPSGPHTPQHPISSASLNSSPVGGGALPSRSSPVTGASHHQHHLLHNSTTPPSAAPPPPPSGPVVSSHHLQHHPPPQHHLASGGIAVSSHGGVMSSGHIPPPHHTPPGGVQLQHPQIAARQQQPPQQPPTRHPSGGAVSGVAHHRVVSPHDRRPVTHSPQENGGLEGGGEYSGKGGGYHRSSAAGGGIVTAQPHSPSMMPPHQPPPPQHHRHSPAGGIYHSSLSPSSSQAPPHALMHPGPLPPNSSPSMGVGGSSRLVHTSGGAPPPPPPGAGVYQMVSPPASHHGPMPHHSSQVVRRSVADTVEKR